MVRGGEQVPHLYLLLYRYVRVGGHEQVLVDEHVAARIPVGPGSGRQEAERAAGEHGRGQHAPQHGQAGASIAYHKQ